MTKLQQAEMASIQQVRDAVDGNNNNNSEGNDQNSLSSGGCGGKYLLRPRSVRALRRCDSEWSLQDNRRQKSRPAPLSKYRRKTANTRERYRMRQINTAFEKLRKILPACGNPRGNTSEMTKITTLKYACAYIRSLQDVLDDTVNQHRLEGGSPGQDSCPWMFSGVLQDPQLLQGTAGSTCHVSQGKTQPLGPQSDPETDLMSLLCDSTDSGIFDDGLGSYLSPLSETDEVTLLLLGSDAPSWHDQTHPQFAVC
ncbi:class A basic helix-loop-helix protein 15-like [Scylla paramamosain]|uniref:class A basic helix-loop-helix protein 15-like n=1 Tax=Scylla paramamosain TaxID=85552 RepID=UPI0030836273